MSLNLGVYDKGVIRGELDGPWTFQGSLRNHKQTMWRHWLPAPDDLRREDSFRPWFWPLRLDNDDTNDNQSSTSFALTTWGAVMSHAIDLVYGLSGTCSPQVSTTHIFRLRSDGMQSWWRLKDVNFSADLPHFNNLIHKAVFPRDVVSDKRHQRDVISFNYYNNNYFVLLHAVYRPEIRATASSQL